MKNFIVLIMVAVTFLMFGISQCHAATKCERDYTGGICCWDTNTEGPFKPMSCY